MDYLTLVLILLLSIISTCFLLFRRNSSYKRSSTKLPPGPFPIPIIGNLLQLGPNPPHSLTQLSKTYGPLMYLRLGKIDTIVASSPESAKEILQKHDQVCSSRFVPNVAHAMNHHKLSIGWLPVGNKWRKFRKICKEQMFSVNQLNAREGVRKEKLKQLCHYLHECSTNGRLVNIGDVAFKTSLNLISTTLFSVDFAQFDSDSTQEIKETLRGLMKVLGTPSLTRYFPLLNFIDPQGLRRDAEVYFASLLAMLDEIICQRLQSRSISSNSSRKNDVLEVLLGINQRNESDLSKNEIKHLLLDLIVAGVDTTTDSVQWAMTELLRNPDKMSKAKDEIMNVIGKNKQVEESDISKLSYLSAVIKETLRVHPPAPFLVPHKAEVEVEINGNFIIPKDAEILVNVWAIGRDSKIWSNPNSFEPERFLDDKIDYRGQNYQLIPFGSGRRMCPGMPLADRMLHLMIAYLIHNFDWKLEPEIQPEQLDMNEIFGLSLHKAVPLKAFPINK